MIEVLQRRPDWPERLAFFLQVRGLLPFAWVVNDCAMCAADCARDLTGFDLAHDLRGAYRDEISAARVLKRHGGLLAIATDRLPVYLSPLQAHRGDLVCVDVQGRMTLGIVAGNGRWAAPGERGLEYRPMAEVRHAFAVG